MKKQEKNKRDLSKKLAKAHAIKEGQENICRFIAYKCTRFEIVNGKRKNTGYTYGRGLQVVEKCYLENGQYKLVNGKNFHITECYDGIPEWANEYLISLYNQKTDRK